MTIFTNYVLQCADILSGECGCFLFDVEHWQQTGQFKAVSPVFRSLMAFYEWDNANGRKRKEIHLDRVSV